MIIKPAALRLGQTIAVISPAGPSEKECLQAGFRELTNLGYRIKVGKHAGGRKAFFSGTDKERLDDLVAAFKDRSVRAILCSRGGYGSNRLLGSLPYDLIAQNPKIFVGFSDLTALNWSLLQRSHLVTFTGPLVNEFGEGLPKETIDSFLKIITGADPPQILYSQPLKALRSGNATGSLLAGCLSIIVTLLGTPFLPKLKGAILVLEDVGEKPYQVDRMLVHLKNAGIFDQVSGLVIGRMIGCWPKTHRKEHLTLDEMLLDLTSARPIPIYKDLPYGHQPERLTLPLGVKVRVSPEGGLELLEDPLQR